MNDYLGSDGRFGLPSRSARSTLKDQVIAVLEADARVARVELVGSLASGRAGRYSDIDLHAILKAGVLDRAFFENLPSLMDRVGPRVIDGITFAALRGVT